MKSLLAFVVLFLYVQDSISISTSDEKCFLRDKIPEVVAVITKWMVNGYKSKRNTQNSNDLIMADCMAGFFGQKNPTCVPKNLTTKSVPALPICSNLIVQGHFHDIVSSKPQPVLIGISGFIETFIFLNGGDPDEVCEHAIEYVKHRLQFAEGGKFQQQKMDDYCKQNEEVCTFEKYFLKDVKTFLRVLMSLEGEYVDIMRTALNQAKDAVRDLIILILERNSKPGPSRLMSPKNSKKYEYPNPYQTKVHEKFSACIREFFQVMSDKLS